MGEMVLHKGMYTERWCYTKGCTRRDGVTQRIYLGKEMYRNRWCYIE